MARKWNYRVLLTEAHFEGLERAYLAMIRMKLIRVLLVSNNESDQLSIGNQQHLPHVCLVGLGNVLTIITSVNWLKKVIVIIYPPKSCE